ncbi:hypothetical protein Anas_02955 [Armadillidium nasatum]|uniref:Uncharacterized protein n=1 Tax=Armadillidium nasatum TaxID=96803 RepID=A0A5N5SWB4_9CRUS|nr:hypothetical protein Anas_02955 [Armadillidium nasatum]
MINSILFSKMFFKKDIHMNSPIKSSISRINNSTPHCTSRGDSDLKEELGECESGWEYFNGTCYLDSSSSALLEKAREKNFLDSQSECIVKNSILLSLTPEEEGVFLQYLLDFKLNQKDIFKLQRYWLRNEHEEQNIKKESGENCSTFSIDLKSLKYFKSNAENCLMKHNYICMKRSERSSNDLQTDCYFFIIHPHPSWNSPFRSSYNSPFWDDFVRSHPYPRYLYHDPLNVMTFHNVRKRLQIELPKRKANPLLPIFQSRIKIPSSKNSYFIDGLENDVGKPMLRNHSPIRVLDIMKYKKKDKVKKPPTFIGCRDDDVLINETCFHSIKIESMKVARKICKRDYNGILDDKTSDPFSIDGS